MAEFEKIERALFRRPILLHAEDPNDKFPAFVDVDEKYNINDKVRNTISGLPHFVCVLSQREYTCYPSNKILFYFGIVREML